MSMTAAVVRARRVVRTRLRLAPALLALATVVGISACGNGDNGEGGGVDGGTALPAAIGCNTQFRPDAESMNGAESPTLLVERNDGISPAPVTHLFAPGSPNALAIEISYQGSSPEGNAISVAVRDEAGELQWRALYQIATAENLAVDFAGGHGFTGLHLIEHAGASLQVWCRAE